MAAAGESALHGGEGPNEENPATNSRDVVAVPRRAARAVVEREGPLRPRRQGRWWEELSRLQDPQVGPGTYAKLGPTGGKGKLWESRGGGTEEISPAELEACHAPLMSTQMTVRRPWIWKPSRSAKRALLLTDLTCRLGR